MTSRTDKTAAEEALLATLAAYPPEGRACLVAGNRSGHLALALCHAGARVAAHAFDCHHARMIRDRLAEAGYAAEDVVRCTPAVPAGPYARAYFMTTPLSMTAELVLDQLEDIRANMMPQGVLFAAFEGDADDALKTVKKVFAHVRVLKRENARKGVSGLLLARAVVTAEEISGKRRGFAAEWPASVPGGTPCLFTSLPGCFCHRRADGGGLALAETAALTLAERIAGGLPEDYRILDMGCGAGFVGLLVADFIRGKTGRAPFLTLLDSHTRALAAAKINAGRLGFTETEYILSDDGLDAAHDARYDLFLGNPPYFGDWRIAEIFLRAAARALKPGGLCLTVSKGEGGLKELQVRLLGETAVTRRRGYHVFSSRQHA